VTGVLLGWSATGVAGVRRARAVTRTAILLVAAFLVASVLGGCVRVRLSADSPRMVGYTISSSSTGTETSQRVVVVVRFDRAITVTAGSRRDLVVHVDGDDLSGRTAAVTVRQAGGDALAVVIAAAPEAAGPASGLYFALHYGKLSITAADGADGLAHVTGVGGASARFAAIRCLVPSGLRIAILSTVRGDAIAGRPARATFRVAATPVVRVVSWLELAPRGPRVFVHNHEFLVYEPDTYAVHLATSLSTSFGSTYRFAVQGATVTVTATRAVDGQVLRPAVCEGAW
jgi:hypothetical protein